MATGFINKLPGGIEVVHRPAERQFGDVNLTVHRRDADIRRKEPSFPRTEKAKQTHQHSRSVGRTCGSTGAWGSHAGH